MYDQQKALVHDRIDEMLAVCTDEPTNWGTSTIYSLVNKMVQADPKVPTIRHTQLTINCS